MLLSNILRQTAVFPIFPFDLNAPTVARLDFSAANPFLVNANLRETLAFDALVQRMLAEKGASIGIGGYLENRIIYRRSPDLFGETGPARSLHLGVDVWCTAGTPVHTPLPATIHSLADNAHFGDYGPTVILEHALGGIAFWTLYGHLGRAEVAQLQPGQQLEAGEAFATVGPWPENGDWPPHLHFQIISDLQGRSGDFPGVAVPEERDYWAALCPDPNLLLRSLVLNQ